MLGLGISISDTDRVSIEIADPDPLSASHTKAETLAFCLATKGGD
jgi:hypothetical protein